MSGAYLELSLAYGMVSRIFSAGHGRRLESGCSTGSKYRCRRLSGPAEEQPVHAVAHVTQVGLIAFFQFRHGATGVSDFSEGLAHYRPVYIAVAEINPGVSVFPAFEIFEVDLHDPLAKRSNPVLRVAVEQHVADVEPRFDPRAVELVDVAGHFERAQEELVPDFLDGDHDFQIFGKRNKFADLLLRARPSVAIRGLRIHDGGNEQNRIRTPELSVMQGCAHSREALFQHSRVTRG